MKFGEDTTTGLGVAAREQPEDAVSWLAKLGQPLLTKERPLQIRKKKCPEAWIWVNAYERNWSGPSWRLTAVWSLPNLHIFASELTAPRGTRLHVYFSLSNTHAERQLRTVGTGVERQEGPLQCRSWGFAQNYLLAGKYFFRICSGHLRTFSCQPPMDKDTSILSTLLTCRLGIWGQRGED